MHNRTPVLLGLLALACQGEPRKAAGNASPTAEITSHTDGDQVIEDIPFVLRGTVSDDDHETEVLLATWSVLGEVLCAAAAPGADGTTECEAVLGLDETDVLLEVTDPKAGSGQASVQFSVQSNGAPEAEILSPIETNVYYSDQKVTFEALVSDPEDDPDALVAHWTSDVDGDLDVSGIPETDGSVVGSSYLSEGEHFVELTVTDTTDRSANAFVTVRVGPPNSPPTCAITGPEEGSFGPEGEMVVFEGLAADVDVSADWLTVEWYSDKDGLLGSSTPSSDDTVSFPFSGLSVNTHVVTLSVTDDAGELCTADVIYTVGQPPEIVLVSPVAGDVFNDGDVVPFTATISDTESLPGELSVHWESDIDGVLSTTGSDSSGEVHFTTDALTVGTHSVSLTVTDTDELYNTAHVTFRINGLPTAPEIGINPDPAMTDDDLVVAIDTAAVDPEGESLSYGYAWFLDGVESEGATESTLPAGETAKGQTWRVEVTPDDGTGAGPVGSAERLISNSLPVIAEVTLSPSAATTETSFECLVGITTDADEDPVTVQTGWLIDGVETDHVESTLAASETVSGNEIACTVTPNDGEEDGLTLTSSAVLIENTAPSIESVVIAPDPAVAGDVLLCSYEGYADPDDLEAIEDASYFAWTLNDVDVGDGPTLEVGFVHEDEITCTVTPYDGASEGAPLTASLIISNTAPSIETVTINPDPGPGVVGDVLTCSWVGFADPDDHADVSTVHWTINGSDAGTALTLAEGFVGGDEVICEVTPFDGVEPGEPVTGTLIVDNTPPELTSISISPDTGIDTATTLTCSATATDVDGETPTLSYAWTNATTGESLGEGPEVVLTPEAIQPEETVRCTATATDGDGSTDSIELELTVDNTNPLVDTIGITPDTGVDSSTTLTCTATASDADGGAPGIEYSWFETTVGSLLGSGSVLELTPGTAPPGSEVQCTASATDDHGGVGEAATSVTVENRPPEVTSVTISPMTGVDTSTTLECSATATDPDEEALTIRYAWTNETEGSALGEESSLTLTPTISAPFDSIVCTATAVDGAGDEDSATASVSVENTDPVMTAAIISPSEDVRTSTTLSCTATATDADGDTPTLTTRWTHGTSGDVLGDDIELDLTPTISSPDDTIVCTVTALDSDGGSASESATVTVANTAPEISAVVISPDSDVETSDTLTCTISATDADGDTPTFEITWTNETEGIELGEGSTVELTPTTSAPGDAIVCSVVASDPDGGSDSASDFITVKNLEPVVTSIAISPSTDVFTGTTLTCTAAASDEDGDPITMTYAWHNGTDGSEIGTGSDIELTTETSGPGDSVVCTATADDGRGGTGTDTASVTVENTPPVISLVEVSPESGVITYSTLTCSTEASDVDGDTPTITVVWTNDDTGDELGTESTLDLDPLVVQPGETVTCTSTATDPDGGTDTDSTSVIVENTPPVLTSVDISPSTGVVTSTTLTCSATATDDDGESPSITYAWTNTTDGSTLGTGSALTLTPTTSSPSDTITCTATAADSDGGSDSDSTSVTVENTNPTVDTVSVSPSTGVVTSTSLTCTATASDVDGDDPTITYAWTNTTEGTTLGTGSTVTLSPSTTSPSDTITCTATAADADGGTSSDTDAISVDNTDPTVDVVSISPESGVVTSSTLTCSASASDDDGDDPTITYAWTNTTEGTSLGTGSTLTLTPTTSSPSDSIVCTATATDSDGGSDSDSTSVTVENTNPTVDSVSVSPDSGVVTSTTLTCSATASDDDGDDPTITYVWTNDTEGTSLGTGSTVTLAASTSSPSDTIVCTATATDGDDGTGSDEASVTVENTNPTVDTISVSPSSGIVTSTTLTCSATASDVDGDDPTITYAWTNSSEGTSLGTGSTVTLAPTTSSPEDSITCTATATDSDGGTDSDSDSVSVDNTDPEMDSVNISPSSSVYATTTLTCSASASDDDGGTPSYTYAWTNSSEGTSLGTGSSLTLTGSTTSPDDTIVCTATATDEHGGTDTGTDSVTVKNTDPTVDTVSVSPSSGVVTSSTLTCSATASDDDGDDPTITYAWANDTEGTSLGTGVTVVLNTTTSSPSDTIICTATAADSDGGSGSNTASVSVENTNPTVDSVSVSPSSGIVTSTTLTCSASASDADGDDPSITYAWTNTSEGTSLGSGSSVTLSPTTSSPEDTITCTATATDADAGTGSDTDSVSIDNTDPEMDSVSISPSSDVVATTTLTCSASASDDDGGTPTYTYAWTNSSEGTSLGTGSSLTLTGGTTTPGDTIVCTATATDAHSGTDTGTDSVSVENTAPVISSVSISPSSSVYATTTLTCSASASDDDEDTPTLSYAWTNSSEGTSMGTGSSLILTASTTSPDDTIVCTVTATDPEGDTDTDSTSVSVENSSPVIASVTVTPSEAYTTTEVTCEVSASDADGDTPSYEYSWRNMTAGIDLGFESSIALDNDLTSPGDSIRCTATATDSEGATDSDSGSVTLENTLPEFTALDITPSTGVDTSTSLTCFAVATDDDGDTPGITYTWENTTTGEAMGSDTHVALTIVTSSPGDVIQCTATASDTDGGTTVDTVTVTVENTNPVLTTVSIFPDSDVKSFTPVTCSTSATDDDGDSPTITYVWTNDDTGETIGLLSALSLTSDEVDPGDTVTCTATATDAHTGTDTGSASVIIENIDPIIVEISISPSSDVYVTTELTCSAEGLDDDGEPGEDPDIAYAWTNASEGTSLGTGSTLTLTASDCSIGDTITCTATATDPEDGTGSDSTSVTIENAPPEVDSVSLSPSTVYTDDTITASVSTSDDDDDTVTVSYAWYVSGEEVEETGSTLDGDTYFDKDDEVYVEVTPSDGTDSGDTSTSSTLTILNTAPTAPSISFSPDDPYGGEDDIICVIDSSSTDADDDTITYTIEWDVDGDSFTDTSTTYNSGDTVSADDTLADEEWTCTITPNDGDDDGSSASTSATLSECFTGWDDSTVSLTSADYQFVGEAATDYAGYAVGGAGDVDGDGKDDLIVGAYGDDDGGSSAGAAYLILASSLSSETSIDLSDADYKFVGEAADDYAGWSVAIDGDVDGDGYDDIVIGAKEEGTDDSGAAYVILGSSLGSESTIDLSDADYKLAGESSDDVAGHRVAYAGDVDGDGKDDVLISATEDDDGGTNAGAVYLILGTSLDSDSSIDLGDADYKFTGKSANDKAGEAVAGAGDVDDDGQGDFLIGAHMNDDGGTNAGAVYLILGSSLGTESSIDLADADYEFVGEASEDQAGRAIVGIGDVDADDYDDILIGAYTNDNDGGTDAGAAYVILGSSLGSTSTIDLSDADYTLIGEEENSEVGRTVARAGDVDEDGYDDLLVGSVTDDDAATNAGATFLVLGSELGSTTTIDLADADYKFQGEATSDQSGSALFSAGDVDGDGLEDFIIGAVGNSDGGSSAGAAYLLISPNTCE